MVAAGREVFTGMVTASRWVAAVSASRAASAALASASALAARALASVSSNQRGLLLDPQALLIDFLANAIGLLRPAAVAGLSCGEHDERR